MIGRERSRSCQKAAEIAARELPAGKSALVDVSGHFREPDGQPLACAMAVSDDGVLDISAAGSDDPRTTVGDLAALMIKALEPSLTGTVELIGPTSALRLGCLLERS